MNKSRAITARDATIAAYVDAIADATNVADCDAIDAAARDAYTAARAAYDAARDAYAAARAAYDTAIADHNDATSAAQPPTQPDN